MRQILATMFLAFIACLAACGGSEARGPEPLFDTTRSDVSSFKSEDGRALGLVNTTHGVLWDYEHGYTRFSSNNEVVWGPLASVPEADLASIHAKEAAQSADGAGMPELAAIHVGGGGGGVGPGNGGVGGTVCTCCFVRHDGTCGCMECVTK